MKRVLFVCLGNICRSPLAQGIFEHKVQARGIAAEFEADSAGTSGWHQGEAPHKGSIAIAKKSGVSIERQKSRAVRVKDGEIFDYVLAMDTANYESLITEFQVPRQRTFLMRDFSLREPKRMGLSVPDPWGHGSEAFEDVYAILDDAIEGFLMTVAQNS